MRAKAFFEQVKVAAEELKVLNSRVEYFEDIGFSFGGMSSDGLGLAKHRKATSRVEMAACGAADVLTAIEERREKFLAQIAHAEEIISKIPQDRYRKLLQYHYLAGKSLKWVSDELDYSGENSIYKAHQYALSEAQKIIDNEKSPLS